jgi:hypothetical protein
MRRNQSLVYKLDYIKSKTAKSQDQYIRKEDTVAVEN